MAVRRAPEALVRGLVHDLTGGDVVGPALAACRRLSAMPAGPFAAIKAALRAPAIERARVQADALRQAFMATMNDPDFRSDAEKSKLEINPVAGEKVDALVREIYRTPQPVTQHAAAILN